MTSSLLAAAALFGLTLSRRGRLRARPTERPLSRAAVARRAARLGAPRPSGAQRGRTRSSGAGNYTHHPANCRAPPPPVNLPV
ncbi:MAG: hypothetical protein ACT4PL_13875, partial [Phycisphaerales bacterium]